MRWINQRASGINSSLKQSRTAARFVIARIIFPALMMTALLLSAAAVIPAQHNASHADPQAVWQPPRFDITRINEPVVKAFQNAWRLAGSGAKEIEAVILIFKKADGA